MKKGFLALMMLLVLLAVTGCGGGDGDDRTVITTEIESTLAFDGYIREDALGNLQITRAATSLFAGLNPSTPDEFRAFLDFSLGSVPLNAFIEQATLEIFVRDVVVPSPAGSVPMRIELLSFPPPFEAEDYDVAPEAGTSAIIFPILISDIGKFVRIDVTPFMRVAQARPLSRFQIRILQDFGTSLPGLVEIDDTNANVPLLIVSYF